MKEMTEEHCTNATENFLNMIKTNSFLATFAVIPERVYK